jgi:predicted TIM-barrel fold metal-dependent hydrolase
MTVVGLFDSLSHPTLTGGWFGQGFDASFEALARTMHTAGFARACAVGLAGQENYAHAEFAARCRSFPELVPIAGVAPKSAGEIDRELDEVHDLGFRGIKLHSRLSRFTFDDPRLVDTFRAATKRQLPVFLCTYFHSVIERYPDSDPLFALARALKSSPGTRIVLLHGGSVELMRWMQFARHTPNILLDLSFTLMKYRGSSLDSDLRWLFKNFHERTCIGVDHPEYEHTAVKERFQELANQASLDAARAIGGRNLARFLGVDFE